MNRIEEVKKILTIMDNDSVGKHGLHGYMVKDYAKQICQLFPQPLDDKELGEKMVNELSERIRVDDEGAVIIRVGTQGKGGVEFNDWWKAFRCKR